MIDDAERNAEEIQHSAFSCNRTVALTLCVDVDLSSLGDFRLLSDRNGSGLGLLEVVDEFLVVKDGSGVSF